MDAVMAYMIKNDCRLDEAIAAVSDRGLASRGQEAKKRVDHKSSATEKPKTKLKAARMAAGLSQSQLAEKAGIKLRTLQSYEQGTKSFDSARLETILSVAIACGCKLEDLAESPALLDLLADYRKMC